MMDFETSLARARELRGRIVVVGPADAGKSAWTRSLAARRSAPLGVVSGDPGQPLAGAPGLLAALVPCAPDLAPASQTPTLLHFLGTTRTSGRTAQLIQGVQRLVRTAEEACDTILIDTGGYVQGPGGRDYKCALLGALAPCTAVFLGEDPVLDPLRHWVAARADIESLDVARPAAARRRGRGERRRERAAMHEAWLAAGQHRIVPLHEGLVLGPGCGIGRSVDARTRAALAASMCVVTGWRHGRPALDVTGRLLRTPGSVWTLGEQPG